MDNEKLNRIACLAVKHDDAPETGLLLHRICNDVAKRIGIKEQYDFDVLKHIVANSLIEQAYDIIEEEGIINE